MRPLYTLEAAAVLALAAGLAIAARRPTSLRWIGDYDAAQRVFPVSAQSSFDSTFQLPAEAGGAVLSLQNGCLTVGNGDGPATGPVCNTGITCREKSYRPTRFEVYRASGDAFYAMTGSECDSTCCDWRGMLVSGHGTRLDDGFEARTYGRMGWLGKVGAALLVAATVWQLARVRASVYGCAALILGVFVCLIGLMT